MILAHQGGIVDHLAHGAEGDRAVGIAFTRGERIAERDDEEVLDHHLALAQLAAVRQLHRHRDPGARAVERIRDARDGQLVLAGKALRFRLAAGLARLPAPDAVAGHVRELLGRDGDRDRMRLRQHVIFLRRAPRIFALAYCGVAPGTAVAVVAGLADGLRRPAEAALLIALAG